MGRKTKRLTFLIAGTGVCLFAAGLFTQPEAAAKGISDGLLLCVNVIIPSLFPFIALAAFLNKSGLADNIGKVLSPTTRILFRLPGVTACTVLMGLIGGYPVGGKMIAALYEEEKITARQAHRLFCFCVNPGHFCNQRCRHSGIGEQKTRVSPVCVTCTLQPADRNYLRCCRQKIPLLPTHTVRREKRGLIDAYVNSVADAAASIYGVCAWVVLFSCIIALLTPLHLIGWAQAFIACVLECSCGCAMLPDQSLPLLAAVLGWGGISVQCQLLPYVLKTNMKPLHFILGRLLHALTAYGMAQLLLMLFPQPVQVLSGTVQTMPVFSSVSAPATVGLITMSGLLILDVDRKEKIC